MYTGDVRLYTGDVETGHCMVMWRLDTGDVHW